MAIRKGDIQGIDEYTMYTFDKAKEKRNLSLGQCVALV